MRQTKIVADDILIFYFSLSKKIRLERIHLKHQGLFYLKKQPGRVAQSVGHLTRKSGVLGSIPGLATYFRFFFRFSRRAVVSYWRKYVHEVLVNRLGGLSLPRKSVVRLTDRPDMTLDVYRGRKTTMQQQQLSEKQGKIFMNVVCCRLCDSRFKG